MRITNGIMINNTLTNINNNKIRLDKLNTQMASEKKIQRPSEDPIVAIRSLRFRSTMAEIEQYLDKNIPDAKGWMEATSDALENVVTQVTKITDYINEGVNGTLGTTERLTIIDTLSQYRDQIYAEGNADYAGRTVFTGYKTDSTLTFTSNEPNMEYSISQNFSFSDITSVKKVVNSIDVSDLNAANISSINVADYDTPGEQSVYRLRLGYGELSSGSDITLYNKDASGNVILPGTTITVTTISEDNKNAYLPADDKVNFIPETGEYVFGKDAYVAASTSDQISVEYVKKGFDKGDLRPEQFYNCTNQTDSANKIKYTKQDQSINYSVNFNQKLKINTQADEVYTPDMTRDIDNLVDSVSAVKDIEDKVSKLKNLQKNETEGSENYEKLQSLIDIANRELDFAQEHMQKAFESSLGKFQDYQENISLAKADVGNRQNRLTLNETRLSSQKLTVKELMTKNEGVVLTDLAVEFKSATDVYDASLAAAAKVVTKTLLDFI